MQAEIANKNRFVFNYNQRKNEKGEFNQNRQNMERGNRVVDDYGRRYRNIRGKRQNHRG